MKNINIPEPCSENWNEMTPTEKGAFCQKCALDVYDFTNKTGDEIRDILTLNIGSPVCMRIKPDQIDELNTDFAAWKMDNKQSFHRAWVFTLFVVFGMTLFSCEEDEEPVVEKFHKIGQTILSTANSIESLIEKDIQIESSVESEKAEQTIHLVEEPELIEVEQAPLLGEAEYDPSEVVIIDEVVIDYQMHLERSYATAGVPMISKEYNDYLVETVQSVEDNELNVEKKITGLVYPNPASNQTTLQIQVPIRGKGSVELYALSGQKVRTIHSGRIKKGESEFPIDLTDLETGFYLVVVSSGELKETIKFSKI